MLNLFDLHNFIPCPFRRRWRPPSIMSHGNSPGRRIGRLGSIIRDVNHRQMCVGCRMRDPVLTVPVTGSSANLPIWSIPNGKRCFATSSLSTGFWRGCDGLRDFFFESRFWRVTRWLLTSLLYRRFQRFRWKLASSILWQGVWRFWRRLGSLDFWRVWNGIHMGIPPVGV